MYRNLFTLVFVLAGVLLVLSLSLLDAEWAVAIATGIGLLLIGLGLIIVMGPTQREPRVELWLFLSAFAIRIVMVIAIYQFGLVQILKDDDASLWAFGAWLAKRWDRMDWVAIAADASTFMHQRKDAGYFLFLGSFFYTVGGISRLAAGFINAWFGSLTVVLTYRMTVLLFERKAARYAGIAACLSPSLIVWSTQTLKEPIVIFLEVLALYTTLRMQRQFSIWRMLLISLCILALATMRFYVSYIVASAILLGLFSEKGLRSRLTAIGAALIIIIALSLTGVLGRDTELFARFNLNYVTEFRAAVARGPGSGSGVANQYDLRSPPQLALALALGAAHLLMAPFPWQMVGGSLRMLLSLPEMVVWWWLVWFALLPGVREALRRFPVGLSTVLIFCLTIGLLYSLMFGNIGLVFRQRAQLLPFLLVFVGVGLSKWARRGRQAAVPPPAPALKSSLPVTSFGHLGAPRT